MIAIIMANIVGTNEIMWIVVSLREEPEGLKYEEAHLFHMELVLSKSFLLD